MNLKAYYEKLKGSTMACIGFILSPLSWWNDLYVNIPIAYFCAWIFSLFYPGLFMHAFVFSYLATNVLGFFLLHKGIRKTLSRDDSQRVRYGRRDFMRDMVISLVYTLLIVILVKLNVIRPLQEYKELIK